MKKTLVYSAFIALGLAVTGCSAATKYHAKNYSGEGYTDYRLAADRFNVSFRANEYTDQEDVQRFALRRAAEVTTNHGYRYFTVLSEKDISRSKIIKNKEEYSKEDEFKAKKEPSIWDIASDTMSLINGKKINQKRSSGNSTTHVYEAQYPAVELSIRCYTEDPGGEAIDAYRFLAY